MNFPDRDYLQKILERDRKRSESNDLEAQLLANSGMFLNWVAEFVTDNNMQWVRQTLSIDNLYLTGTEPKLNTIVIEQAQRNTAKLRELLVNPEVKEAFAGLQYSDQPILVRIEDDKLKVLDGMHRTLAAIRDGHPTIDAFVGSYTAQPQPQCEAHVVYDLIRSYQRGINKDREGLIAALRFLKKSYVNVEPLLRERFDPAWLPDEDMQGIIREVLA